MKFQTFGGGSPVVTTFALADLTFSAQGAMTWTTAGATLLLAQWIKNGVYNTFFFRIGNSTVGGVVNAQLRLALPAVVPLSANIATLDEALACGSVYAEGAVQELVVPGIGPNSRTFDFRRVAGGNWVAGAQNISCTLFWQTVS